MVLHPDAARFVFRKFCISHVLPKYFLPLQHTSSLFTQHILWPMKQQLNRMKQIILLYSSGGQHRAETPRKNMQNK